MHGGGLGAEGREKNLYVLFERDESQAGGLFHLFLLSFYFEITPDIRKSCKNSTKISHIPFT